MAEQVGNRDVKMVERPVISEPFEFVSVDIVGLLSKGKGEYALCLSISVWPRVG